MKRKFLAFCISIACVGGGVVPLVLMTEPAQAKSGWGNTGVPCTTSSGAAGTVLLNLHTGHTKCAVLRQP